MLRCMQWIRHATHRHGKDELQHREPDGRCINEPPTGENKVCEGPLAGIAMGKLLMRVLVIPAGVKQGETIAPSIDL